MALILIGALISIALNIVLGSIILMKKEPEEFRIPEQLRLNSENLVWLLNLININVVTLRAGNVTTTTAQTIVDWEIILYKLKYLHASTTKKDGKILSRKRLADVDDIPGYTKQQIEDLYEISGRG